MITDNRINRFEITWTAICTHTYERVSRSKWRILMNYVCGAHMSLEGIPDDLIQCLVLGAYSSGLAIEANTGSLPSGAKPLAKTPILWIDFQAQILGVES
ncbi:MAG: hypothetical protein U1F68_12070 [Gammaproteobacteria bacterium]